MNNNFSTSNYNANLLTFNNLLPAHTINKTSFRPVSKLLYGLVLKHFVFVVLNQGCYCYDLIESSNNKNILL